MKTLKTIIVVATLLIVGMAFTGCDDETSAGTLTGQSTIGQPDTTKIKEPEKAMDSKEKKAVLDSVNMVNSRVDDLSSKINTQNTAIEDNKSTIDDLKKSLSMSTLISWIVAAISLIVAIIAIVKVNSVSARAARHRQEIEELKGSIHDLDLRYSNSSRPKVSTSNNVTYSEYSALSSRVSKIERYLDSQSHTPTIRAQEQVGNNHSTIIEPISAEKNGYFELPSQMPTSAYFRRLLETKGSDARFAVVIKQNNKAEFSVFDSSLSYLRTMTTSDTAKLAIEFIGCSSDEATQMRQIMPGEAVLEDGRWIITRKAQVNLSR